MSVWDLYTKRNMLKLVGYVFVLGFARNINLKLIKN